MAIIIGSATNVEFGGACVIQAQWGFTPNNQDAYCLDGVGDPVPARTTFKPEQSLSLTLYAPGPVHAVPLTKNCVDASVIAATITPGSCSGAVGNITGNDWMVTSYNYSKETRDAIAQESWSLVKYLGFAVEDISSLLAPTAVLRTASQGQSSNDSTGVIIPIPIATANTGSISVGSLGKAETMNIGKVTQVGGGGGATSSPAATGSAQMAYTPIYV